MVVHATVIQRCKCSVSRIPLQTNVSREGNSPKWKKGALQFDTSSLASERFLFPCHNTFRGLCESLAWAQRVSGSFRVARLPVLRASPLSTWRVTGYIFRAQQDMADPLRCSPAPVLAQAKFTGWISVGFSNLLQTIRKVQRIKHSCVVHNLMWWIDSCPGLGEFDMFNHWCLEWLTYASILPLKPEKWLLHTPTYHQCTCTLLNANAKTNYNHPILAVQYCHCARRDLQTAKYI